MDSLFAKSFEVAGLLVTLACVTLVFLEAAKIVLKRGTSNIRTGVTLLFSLTLIDFFAPAAFESIQIEGYLSVTLKTVELLWWITLAFTIDSAIRKFVWQGLMATHRASHVPTLVRNLVSLLIYSVALTIALLLVFDKPVEAILVAEGGVAVIIGIAAQKTLAEVFAGLSLSLSKSLQVGDFLEVDGIYGQVHEMNWRSVSLHNPHTDSLYVFPNSQIASSVVLNFNRPTDRFKWTVNFTAEINAPPDLVMQSIIEELKHSRYVYQEPPPDIHALEFGKLGVTYRVRYFFEGDDTWWLASNEIYNAIWAAMKRHGFRFSIERHLLRSEQEWQQPAAPAHTEPTETELIKALQTETGFTSLGTDACRVLLENTVKYEFVPPQVIPPAAGQKAPLYLLYEGELHVYVCEPQDVQGAESHSNIEQQVAVISAPAVVGLPAHSPATVEHELLYQAGSYAILHSLDEEQFAAALGHYPELTNALREKVTADQSAYLETLARAANERARQSQLESHAGLIRSLKSHITAQHRKSIFSHLWSAVFSHRRDRQMLDALSAVCAWLAIADSAVDAAEEAYFTDLIEHIATFKHFSHDEIVDDFRRFVRDALADSTKFEKNALALVSRYRGDDKVALTLMGGAHGIAGIGGQPGPNERRAIDQIASTLGVPPELGDTLEAYAETGSH